MNSDEFKIKTWKNLREGATYVFASIKASKDLPSAINQIYKTNNNEISISISPQKDAATIKIFLQEPYENYLVKCPGYIHEGLAFASKGGHNSKRSKCPIPITKGYDGGHIIDQEDTLLNASVFPPNSKRVPSNIDQDNFYPQAPRYNRGIRAKLVEKIRETKGKYKEMAIFDKDNKIHKGHIFINIGSTNREYYYFPNDSSMEKGKKILERIKPYKIEGIDRYLEQIILDESDKNGFANAQSLAKKALSDAFILLYFIGVKTIRSFHLPKCTQLNYLKFGSNVPTNFVINHLVRLCIIKAAINEIFSIDVRVFVIQILLDHFKNMKLAQYWLDDVVNYLLKLDNLCSTADLVHGLYVVSIIPEQRNVKQKVSLEELLLRCVLSSSSTIEQISIATEYFKGQIQSRIKSLKLFFVISGNISFKDIENRLFEENIYPTILLFSMRYVSINMSSIASILCKANTLAPNIRVLELNSISINDEVIGDQIFLEFLNCTPFKNVELLDLSNNEITLNLVHYYINIIQIKFPNLKTLDLSINYIPNKKLCQIPKNIFQVLVDPQIEPEPETYY